MKTVTVTCSAKNFLIPSYLEKPLNNVPPEINFSYFRMVLEENEEFMTMRDIRG